MEIEDEEIRRIDEYSFNLGKEAMLDKAREYLESALKRDLGYYATADFVDTLATITIDGCVCFMETIDTEDALEYDNIKPYLFPLSSMTEEQKKVFDQCIELELKAISGEIDHTQSTAFEVDFYNKHHYDWRGLIPLGLANDATGLNIYKIKHNYGKED